MNPNSGFENDLTSEVSPKLMLLLAAALSFLGAAFGSVIVYLVCQSQNIDMRELSSQFNINSPPELRNFMRGILLLNHLSSFLLPATLSVWILYKRNWPKALTMNTWPTNSGIILGTFFIMAAFPLAQAAMSANMWLVEKISWLQPLVELETSSEHLIEGLLVMDSHLELMGSLIVMALVPAVGEEMMFRGIIQQYLGKWTRKPVFSILVTAFLFSLIHFQVQRFFAILLLGIVLGLLFYWTRNLWLSIAAHFFNNALQVLVAWFSQDKLSELNSGNIDDLHWSVPIVSAILTGVTGYLIWKKYNSTSDTIK